MKTTKDFDCVEMKNAIQRQVYAETKEMDFSELRSYLDNALRNDLFWRKITNAQKNYAGIDEKPGRMTSTPCAERVF